MTNLKAIKIGHEKLQSEVEHWEKEINFYPTEGNIKAQRKAIQQLIEFEKQNEINLRAIEKYPFLAK